MTTLRAIRGTWLKSIVDRLIAAVGLVVAAPTLAVASAAIVATTGHPVLFTQVRAGRGGRPFRVLKLRTMSDARDVHGALLPDEERLTPLGRWLRSSSIDELPQLWNVLAGQMSLVGPRPLPVEYLPRYTPTEARRHEVLPGITGWAQIHGRNAMGWEDRLALDVWYVDHRSVCVDARILLTTMLQVPLRRGISNVGHATMPEFRP
jgi:lipopolysaccharide/colanic/teichoic acid biosynthesis glycosyltransferase